MDDYSRYYYFGSCVYMDPFDKRFLDSLGFLVLIWGRGIKLCMAIKWADNVACLMPVIGEYFVVCSYCLRSPLSRVWRVSLVG